MVSKSIKTVTIIFISLYMKVLLITPNTNNNSGWGRSFNGIKNALEEQGIGCSVLSEDGGKAERLPHLNGLLSWVRSIFTVCSKARSVDIVHTMDAWPYGFYALCARICTGTPYCINAIGTYSVAPLYQISKKYLLACAYRHAMHIFAISEYVKNRIIKKVSLSNISVAHLGLEKLPVPTKEDIKHYDAQYTDLIGAGPLVLTVGALKDRKGQYETVRAMERVLAVYPTCKYIMVGSEADRAYVSKIRAYIKERGLASSVYIISDVKDDIALSYWYTRAKVFVLASKNDNHHIEGFGLVVLEAGQFGVPSVGSRDSGIEDAIVDRKTGLLSKPGDSDDLADKILILLGSTEISFSENARQYADSFQWSHTVEAYISYYKKMTNRSRL